MRYHHLGIPTTSPQPGETCLAQYRTFCTDHERNPFGSQWMRYEPGCPLPELVRTVPHIAFEVDDLAEALVGHKILIEPNSPPDGALVAFVVCDGAPVEFLLIAEVSSSDVIDLRFSARYTVVGCESRERRWDTLFKKTQPQLSAAARRAWQEIDQRHAKPMDSE